MRNPFSLYKRHTKQGIIWYARFWDEKAGKYAIKRSTGVLVEGKRERRQEAERKAREMLPTIRFGTDTAADAPFINYLVDFWKPESPYARECALLKKKPLSYYYVHQNAINVLRYIKTFPKFDGLLVRDITSGLIRDWMAWMADRKGAAGRMISGRRINAVVQTMRVAVRYAVEREE